MRISTGAPHAARAGALLAALWLGAAGAACADGPVAADDDLQALRSEALAYEHGEGVARNAARAVELYCRGARQGDAEAQFNLGWIYANGRGVARDDGLAAYFFRLAARRGHGQAAEMLDHLAVPSAGAPACMLDAAAHTPQLAAEPAEPALTPLQRKVIQLVHRLAPQFGVSPELALAVIRAESGFDPVATSPKNAQGLMQLIPETAARFNVRKPFDPEQNVRGGLSYLRWLLAYFQGNVPLVAAAYNAGEGAVNRYRGIPPYAETRGYVKRIMEEYPRENHPYDAAVTGPSPDLPHIRLRRLM